MNILFTSHRFAPDIGGIESVSQILAEQFHAAGHSVCLVTQSIADSCPLQASFPYSILRKPCKRDLLACYRWADVVFQNNIEARLLWPNLLLRKPLVIAFHTWVRGSNGQGNALHNIKASLICLADKTIACSESIRRECCTAASVIGNPYNSALFRAIPDVQRQKDVVFLGRLVSDKGADLLLQAIARFARPRRPTCTMIGTGPELDSLLKRARDLDLEESVVFSGPLQGEQLVQCLHTHHVMVIPSLWEEPFGVVALEGIACGCVVLASDGGGLPDAVGPAGLLFQRGNVDSLYRNLSRLLTDADLRNHFRAQAPAHLSNFQPETVASRYLQVLDQAVQSRREVRI